MLGWLRSWPRISPWKPLAIRVGAYSLVTCGGMCAVTRGMTHGLYAVECAQSEDPVREAIKKARREMAQSSGAAVAQRIETFVTDIQENSDVITPIISRLLEIGKLRQDLHELVQACLLGIHHRMEELSMMEQAMEQPSSPWMPSQQSTSFQNDASICRLALAAYGPAALCSAGLLSARKRTPSSALGPSTPFLQEFTGRQQLDVIYTSQEDDDPSRPHTAGEGAAPSPAFYVAVDHDAKRIVVAIRGTLSVADVMTDCVAEAAGFGAAGRGSVAHAGMAAAAERVRERAAGAVAAAAAGSGYSALVVTGHSLGGAVAHLLAISLAHQPQRMHTAPASSNLPPSITSIRSVAFGPPPFLSVVDLPLQRQGLPPPGIVFAGLRRPVLTATSYVHDLDIVPRTSLHGAQVFAAFLAGDKTQPSAPQLFLPSEVVMVREEAGRVEYRVVGGRDALLSSSLLAPMLLGVRKRKPVSDHSLMAYDRMFAARRTSA